ncbi:hypothetical protein XcodCFBP4690_02280 [Xanthomonas codiaei]|uniref:Uncharacterized protein n=1 Tax=Xanthomonas codiaei TaxID=56463 RepID=A0A2S7CXS0_9XANT|nr:hypothetical protein XcodCFBP4690_02280 [Xanthomonas codiaei]
MWHGKRPKWRAGPRGWPERWRTSRGGNRIQQGDPARRRNVRQSWRIGADRSSLSAAASPWIASGTARNAPEPGLAGCGACPR